MTKKQFEEKCSKLEADGWWLVEYQPENKYAVYTNGYDKKTVGTP
jgi:hypothetical protein